MATGIPIVKLSEEESTRLLNMEDELHKRVIGQEEAVKALSRAIRRTRAGLKDPKRPGGSFIFAGPSGVGKTWLSKTLAEFLFGDEDSLIQLDMSEFGEKHTVSRLFGSPPGYVGYEEGGQLTEKVRRKPFSVVLFDEVEKAHPDIFNSLLQILEEGRLTDSQGRVVDFKNTVIIMTTNLGTRDIAKGVNLGFQQGRATAGSYDRMKSKVSEELKQHFRPEFLNRVDEIIVFPPLSQEQIVHMVDNMIAGVELRMRDRDMRLELTQAAKNLLAERGFDPVLGARPLRRTIQREIEDVLAEKMLFGEVGPGQIVLVDVEGEGPTATFTFAGQKIGELPDLPPFETAEVASPRRGRRRSRVPTTPTARPTCPSSDRRSTADARALGALRRSLPVGPCAGLGARSGAVSGQARRCPRRRPATTRPSSTRPARQRTRCALARPRPRRARLRCTGPSLSRSTASSRPRHCRSVPAQVCTARGGPSYAGWPAARQAQRSATGQSPQRGFAGGADQRAELHDRDRPGGGGRLVVGQQLGGQRRARPWSPRRRGTPRPRPRGRGPGARWCRARRGAGRRRRSRSRPRCSRRRRAARAGRRTTPAPRRRAARRSPWRPRAAAAPGAGSRAGPRPGPPRRSARRPGRPASASARSHCSCTGSTRATGVCWSMNSETITDQADAPGRATAARGRGRRTTRGSARGGRSSRSIRSPVREAPPEWHRPGAPARLARRRRHAVVAPCPATHPWTAAGPRLLGRAGCWCSAPRVLLVVAIARLLGGRQRRARPTRPARPTTAARHDQPSADPADDHRRPSRRPTPTRRAAAPARSSRPRPAPVLAEPDGTCADEDIAVTPKVTRGPSPAATSRSCCSLRTLESPRPAPGGSRRDTLTVKHHLRRRRHLVEPAVPGGDPGRRTSWSAQAVDHHGRRHLERPSAPTTSCSARTDWALPGWYHVDGGGAGRRAVRRAVRARAPDRRGDHQTPTPKPDARAAGAPAAGRGTEPAGTPASSPRPP